MTNKKFADLFGGPGRTPESRITKREMDIACSIQKVTEKIILTMAKHVIKITKADYLCMSGGVALNCVANGYLDRKNIFKEIWVQPASGDAGSSIGCALDVYYNYFGKIRKFRKDKRPLQLGSCWGPEWNNEEIKRLLGNDIDIFKKKYLVTKEGNFEGSNILIENDNYELNENELEILNKSEKKLLDERKKRVKPFFDDKSQTDLNSFWIYTLLHSSFVLKNKILRDKSFELLEILL